MSFCCCRSNGSSPIPEVGGDEPTGEDADDDETLQMRPLQEPQVIADSLADGKTVPTTPAAEEPPARTAGAVAEEEAFAIQMNILARSPINCSRYTFGSDFTGRGTEDGKGCVCWIKIVRGGTRPEICLLVNGRAASFRARVLPSSCDLQTINELEATGVLAEGLTGIDVSMAYRNTLHKVRLLGFDRGMNLCMHLLPPRLPYP